MLLSKNKILAYQQKFFSKLQGTPYTIELEVTTPQTDEGFSVDNLVGDSPRTSKRYTLRALYQKDVQSRQRDKPGLPTMIGGIVYLSPKQLIPILGDYHIDWNRTSIYFEGRRQVIDKVVYLEEMKEYNTCVGVEIHILDDLKGG